MSKMKPTHSPETTLHLDKHYVELLNTLKDRIRKARLKAAVAVNQELVQLYWKIGQHIIEKQAKTAWGSKFLATLSHDLRTAFPETSGLSVRNLKYMRSFNKAYPSLEIGQQAVAQLPWGHILLLLQKVSDKNKREWYVQKTIENSWSRSLLGQQIKTSLYERQALAQEKTSNYVIKLDEPQSSLAQEMLKNPYNFDFLGLHDDAHERDIEQASVQHVAKFLLELGKGFSFVGHQVPITIDDEEFFIDMLFYHLKLRCYVVIEFKTTKFKPEHAGQLNFYLSAVDDLMKHQDDSPSVGILLCKSHNKTVAEYALRDVEKPIGVSEYQLVKAIPDDLKGTLPTVNEIEAELNAIKSNTDG